MARDERAGLGALFFGSIWLWKYVFGWYGWESVYAIGLSMVTTLVLGLAGEAIRDTWPRGVPYELKGQVETYERAGWKRTRIHPWWQCYRRRGMSTTPHVHLMQGGQLLIVAGKQPQVTRRDIRLPGRG